MPRPKKVSVWGDGQRLYYRWSENRRRPNAPAGLSDNSTNRKTAERIAARMTDDLRLGNFDRTLERYSVPRRRSAGPTLLDLWAEYLKLQECTFSRASLRPLKGTWTKAVHGLPTHDLGQAPAIVQHLRANHTSVCAHRIFIYIKACCERAVEVGRIAANPFEKLKIPCPSDDRDPFPFELAERDAILSALDGNHYRPFVEFLFRTGARPGEAAGLRWGDVKGNVVIFYGSIGQGKGGARRKDGLKNAKHRRVPLDRKTEALLASLRSPTAQPDALVFTSPRGCLLDYGSMGKRVWHPLLDSLGIEARPVYCCRHTAITAMLRAGMAVEDVAALVGNTPGIIYKHYVAAAKDLRLPEL